MKSSFSIKEELWLAVKYGMVGFLNTAVFALSVYFLSRLNLGYIYYTAFAYITAIVFSFLMNMKFTFARFKGTIIPRALKFLATALLLMLAVQVIQYILIEIVGIKEFYAIFTGMIFYTGTGFIINRLWVFR